MNKARGQGSLEYLLLIAGAVLVAIIVFLLLFTFAPTGKTELDTDIAEYKKIDLCTGHSADCSHFANWNGGLTSPPYGVLLENTSSWRTLYVSGVTIILKCGDVACPKTTVNATAQTSFEFPIANTAPLCTVLNPGSPNPPIYSCNQFPVSCTLGTDCFSTVTSPIPFCSGAALGSSCSTFVNFTSNPAPKGPFSLTIPPGQSVKIPIYLSVPPNLKDLTGIQYVFKISQLNTNTLTLSNTGDDYKAQPLFWYSSTPNYQGSAYFCHYSSGAWSAQYGCTFNPGCTLSQCVSAIPGSPEYSFCQAGVPGVGPYSDETIVCNVNNVVTKPTCLNVESGLNPGYYDFSPSVSNPDTAVYQIDVSPFKNAADYVSSVPKGLYISVNQFSSPTCIASNTSGCQAACQAIFSASTFEVVQLPTVADNSPAAMCSDLTAGTVLSTLAATGVGSFDVATGVAHCTGVIQFASTDMSKLSTAAQQGKSFYFGFRVKSGANIHIDSPYIAAGVPSEGPVPAVRALFYPK